MSAATTSVPAGWSRNRLLAILACAGAMALVLVVGFGYAVYLAIHSAVTGTSLGQQPMLTRRQMHNDTAIGEEHRDQIAAQPMLQVTADAMKPTTLTPQLADSIIIPEATRTGPVDVPSGFPHTPHGAVGQLAAMSQTVLGSMSVATAHQVYDAWAMPGGVGAEQWRMTTNVASFLGAAGMGPTKTAGATIAAIPTGALVKGTDGPDWTVACVLFEVDATISSSSSIGYGYCERMQWNTEPGAPADGRWEVAPGSPPTPAPNTWPGSAVALKAGWLTWTSEPITARPDNSAANAPDNPSGDASGTTGAPAE
jgi:hypothetical protein